jgi:hypothetical protein
MDTLNLTQRRNGAKGIAKEVGISIVLPEIQIIG